MVKLVFGNEGQALQFLKNITDEDRIAIFSHTDVDGFVAGRLIHEAMGCEIIDFLKYSPDLISKIIPKIASNKINKIIFTDLSLQQNFSDLEKLAKSAEVLILDHHEYLIDLNTDRILLLKTPSECCASLLCYTLLMQIPKFKFLQSLDWLAAIAVIADFTFEANKEFIRDIEKKYHLQEPAENNIQSFSSDLGKCAILLNNATIYFHQKLSDFYTLFRKIKTMNDLESLKEASSVVEKEISIAIEKCEKNAVRKNEVQFSFLRSKYPIASLVSTLLSKNFPGRTIVLACEENGFYHISARRQDGKVNLPKVLKLATSGLEDATSGGHIKAAGCRIRKRDIDKFKEKILG